jgi:hypothetical protein
MRKPGGHWCRISASRISIRLAESAEQWNGTSRIAHRYDDKSDHALKMEDDMSPHFSYRWLRRIMMSGAVIGGVALTLGTGAGPAQAQVHLAQYYSPYYAPYYARPHYRYGYGGYRRWYRPRWYGGGWYGTPNGNGGVVHDGGGQ